MLPDSSLPPPLRRDGEGMREERAATGTRVAGGKEGYPTIPAGVLEKGVGVGMGSGGATTIVNI